MKQLLFLTMLLSAPLHIVCQHISDIQMLSPTVESISKGKLQVEGRTGMADDIQAGSKLGNRELLYIGLRMGLRDGLEGHIYSGIPSFNTTSKFSKPLTVGLKSWLINAQNFDLGMGADYTSSGIGEGNWISGRMMASTSLKSWAAGGAITYHFAIADDPNELLTSFYIGKKIGAKGGFYVEPFKDLAVKKSVVKLRVAASIMIKAESSVNISYVFATSDNDAVFQFGFATKY